MSTYTRDTKVAGGDGGEYHDAPIPCASEGKPPAFDSVFQQQQQQQQQQPPPHLAHHQYSNSTAPYGYAGEGATTMGMSPGSPEQQWRSPWSPTTSHQGMNTAGNQGGGAEKPLPPDGRGYPAKGKSLSRILLLGLLVLAAAIIILLAGLLGGVASGNIKTPAYNRGAEDFQRTASTPSATAPATVTITPDSNANPGSPATKTSSASITQKTIDTDGGPVINECPSADGQNITARGSNKVWLRQCGANYAENDGDPAKGFGLQNGTILSMADCVAAASKVEGCVAVIFNLKPQCWLKSAIGVRTEDSGEAAVLWQ